MRKQDPGRPAWPLIAIVPVFLLAACGFGDADGRPGARYFQSGRDNAATAADLEAFLDVPVDHRTAIARMQALGARCETAEVLIRIDDSVLCRYATGTSFFENNVWKVTLNVDDAMVVRSVTVDSWRSSTLPRDI